MFKGIRSYDELNVMHRKTQELKSVPFEKYFEEMKLTENEIEKRIALAEKLNEQFTFILVLLFTMKQYNLLNYNRIREEFENRYLKAINGIITIDDDLKRYIRTFSYNVTDSTRNHEGDFYYYSSDRAMFMAENESLTCWNHQDFSDATKSGKRFKQWIDVRDLRERETHLKVGRTIKPLSEPFLVGDSFMQYPKDTSFGADSSEIVNCRCKIKYF